MENQKKIPDVSFFSKLRMGSELKNNPIEALTTLAQEHDGIFKIKHFGNDIIVLSHPDYAKHVLKSNASRYSDNFVFNSFNAFNSNSEAPEEKVFLSTQKAVSTIIKSDKYEEYCSELFADIDEYISANIESPSRESVLNIELELRRMVLKVNSKLFISPQLEINADPVLDAMNDIFSNINYFDKANGKLRNSFSEPFSYHPKMPKYVREAIEYIDGFSQQIVEEFFLPSSEKGILIQALYNEYKQNHLSIDVIVTQVKIFLLEWFEAISQAATWSLFLLDKNTNARKQIENTFSAGLKNSRPDYNFLNQSPLLLSAVKESLRMYPPVWSISKRALTEDSIDGYAIPQGAWVLILNYAIHRNGNVGENPNEFNPERFMNNSILDKSEFNFMPFGYKEVSSFNQDFAIFETAAIVSSLLSRYRIRFRLKGIPTFNSTEIISSKQLILNSITKLNA